MKKKKSEIILIIAGVICAIISIYFYYQSKTIISTTNIEYSEKSNINYKVYLNDKTYYNKEYLDENMQYISSIIDYIDVDFNYMAEYPTNGEFNINKEILADVKIVDTDNNDKIIYSKQETLKSESLTNKEINSVDKIKIDYNKYNNLTNEFKTSYGINADCSLVVTYKIDYQNATDDIVQNRIMSIEIPLSEQMITIDKSDAINNRFIYVGKTTDSTINKLMFTLSMLFVGITLIIVIGLLIEINKRRKKESKYDRFITKTLREYDSYITQSKEENYNLDKPIIKIESFKELLDVRNNVEKTIIYIKIDNDRSKFIIIDDEIYEYSVSREEMDK